MPDDNLKNIRGHFRKTNIKTFVFLHAYMEIPWPTSYKRSKSSWPSLTHWDWTLRSNLLLFDIDAFVIWWEETNSCDDFKVIILKICIWINVLPIKSLSIFEWGNMEVTEPVASWKHLQYYELGVCGDIPGNTSETLGSEIEKKHSCKTEIFEVVTFKTMATDEPQFIH